MSVTVDSEPLATGNLGLVTVGQVLGHLQKENRLVVHLLIDGQEPDLDRIGALRTKRIEGHTLFIETAHPQRMAAEVIDEVESHLDEADALKDEVVELIGQNQSSKAMEKLSGCFRVWQHAEESIQKTSQLLRIDLSKLKVGDQTLVEMLSGFSQRLREIRSSLENRDFVALSDVLAYEMTETSTQWRAALQALRAKIAL